MLSILGLFGVALAAAVWPDGSVSDSGEKSAQAVDSKADQAEAPQMTDDASATGLSSGEYEDDLIDDPIYEMMTGTDDDDWLLGSDGEDTMDGGAGADILDGGYGDDLINGADDDEGDDLIGGDGNDQFWIGAGDHVEGGSGDDDFHLSEAKASFIADYNPDNDKIIFAYDADGPVPELDQQEAEDGIRLLADGKHVATFGGVATFDLTKVYLVAEPA